MSTTIHWDVDTQEDFISAAGKLAVPGAEAIRPALARLTRHAHSKGIRIVATADDHDVGHAEITSPEAANWKTTFPAHCMRGTDGQRKIAETALDDPLVIEPVPVPLAQLADTIGSHRGDILLNKPGLDVFRWNPSAAHVLDLLAPDRIVLYGVATDFCVVAAVEGIRRHRPQAQLTVVRDAIAAINVADGSALCDAWSAAGVTVVDSGAVTS
jgi:nicotinamidase/pyrazinamidase